MFADVSGVAPPLADHVGSLVEHLDAYRTGELRRGARIDYDVAANWKAIVENYSECLHCPGVHPELNRLSHYLSRRRLRGPGRLVRRLDDAHQGGRRHDGHGRRPRRPPADRRRRPARRPVLRDLPELPRLAAPGLRDAAHAVAGRPGPHRGRLRVVLRARDDGASRASTAPTRSSSGTSSTARTGRCASSRSSASARAGYTPGRYTEVESTVHDFDQMVAEAYLRVSVGERILDAAIERIASDGIDAVRIARIAMDAGVSTALVHYHFATREALLAEALEHSFERAGDVRTADTGESATCSGCATWSSSACRCRASRSSDWVLWVELWLRAVRHPELRPTAAQAATRACTRGSRRRSRRGGFDACDADRVADRVLALIDGLGLRALLGDPAMPLERAREEVWDALARDLGVAPPSAASELGFLNRRSENSMSPRPSTAHVRRPAILTAAAEVISERGVQNTRISDVAERAGTSAPGVLYWFPTKDELLAEALQFSDDRFYAELTERARRARQRHGAARRGWSSCGRRRATGRRCCGWSCGCARCATRGWPRRASGWTPLARRDRGHRARGPGDRRVRRRRRGGCRAHAGSGDGWVRDPARARDPAVTPETVKGHCWRSWRSGWDGGSQMGLMEFEGRCGGELCEVVRVSNLPANHGFFRAEDRTRGTNRTSRRGVGRVRPRCCRGARAVAPVTRPQPRGKCGNPRSSAPPADRCRGGSRRAHAELDRASDKLVRLIAEASRGAGGRSDCTLWMEMWARACRKDTASTISGSGSNSGWVVLDARPQFVTALDPGLTGQSV